MNGRVLIIAGSDSGGGAGIQADIKAVTALDAFAMTAVTALTAQNTQGVFGVHVPPVEFISRQIEIVLQDLGADVVKTGMLVDAEVIETVAAALESAGSNLPRVVDPVMVAKGGYALLADDAVSALKRHLLPGAAVITPNLPEAEALTGSPIQTVEDMHACADDLMASGAHAVLLKGGHLEGDRLVDLLITADGIEAFEDMRIDTPHTHGTGCTLASALAAGMAQGMALRDAVVRARAYVRLAIETAPGYGTGHGPLNHAHTVTPFMKSDNQTD